MKLEDIFGQDLAGGTIDFLNKFPSTAEAVKISKENLIKRDIKTINSIRERIVSSSDSKIFWERSLSSNVILFLKSKGYNIKKIYAEEDSGRSKTEFKISWEDRFYEFDFT